MCNHLWEPCLAEGAEGLVESTVDQCVDLAFMQAELDAQRAAKKAKKTNSWKNFDTMWFAQYFDGKNWQVNS